MSTRDPAPGPRTLVAPAAVFLLVWAGGLATLAPGYPHGDSGETAGVAFHLGIAHPPGYPMPVIGGHALTRWLPIGSVAWRASLFALAGASLAAALLAATLRAAMPALPAWLAALLAMAAGCALEPWNQMTLPKGGVYTSTVAALGGIALALAAARMSPGRRGALAGFATGLAAGGHYMMLVPFLPFMCLELTRRLRRDAGAAGWRRVVRAWALGMTLGVAGLSLYVYIPLRTPSAHPQFRWAEPVTRGRFGWLVLRRQYLSIEKQDRGLGGRLLMRRFLDRVRTGWGPAAYLLIPGALVLVVRRRAWWVAALAGGGALEIAAAAYYPKLEPDSLWVADPFFTAGWWALGVTLAAGAALLRGEGGGRRTGAAIAVAVLLAVPAARAGWERVSKRWSYYASDGMANLAMGLPRDALFFAEGDAYIAPLLYGLYVDGQRPDVRMVIPIFLHFGWGLRQIKETYPDLSVPADRPWAHVWQEAKDVMEANPGRPRVHSLTTSQGWPFGRWATVEGLTYGIHVHDRPPEAADIERRIGRWRMRGLFDRRRLDREPFDQVIRDNYVQGTFGRAVWRQARRELEIAMPLFERARRLGSPEAALNAGLIHYQRGRLDAADRSWREARALAPWRPESWANLALVAVTRVPPQPDEAIRLCEVALTKDPRFVKALEVMANAWYLKGDLPQAVGRLREAAALDPGNPLYRRMLEVMMRGAGKRRVSGGT